MAAEPAPPPQVVSIKDKMSNPGNPLVFLDINVPDKGAGVGRVVIELFRCNRPPASPLASDHSAPTLGALGGG